MNWHAIGGTVAVSALVLSGVTVGADAARIPATNPSTGSARVWVTTPDRAELLHERTPVAFTRADSKLTTITVDPDTKYQTMDGFGASITDSSAAVFYRLSAADRRRRCGRCSTRSRASG